MIKICSRCICDSSIPGIEFDEYGVCNYCHNYELMDRDYPLNELGQKKITAIIEKIKVDGKNRKYDCIIGISGGTDSTYSLYLAKKWGLRPLAVHFDNGWNSEISVKNMKNATTKLNVDLHMEFIEHEEFKDIQISFLKASVPEADLPTDIAISALLYKVALEHGIKYILSGSSFRTEGNMPPAWGYGDWKYVQSVQNKFGTKKLKDYPRLTVYDLIYYNLIKRIKVIKPLYYVDYRKAEVMKILETELDWNYYGGHHYESIYTRFCGGYLLPEKFGIDKRIIEYSALIRSNQLSRDEALIKIKQTPYSEDQLKNDMEYLLTKFGLTSEDFEKILAQEPKSSTDYSTYYPLIIKLKLIINWLHRLGLYHDKMYGKYSR